MGPAQLIVKLVRLNLPHLIGIFLYGAIAIILAYACYKVFSKLLGLNTGIDSNTQDRLTSVVLAVGIIISISFLVAVTAYEPPKSAAPAQSSASGSDGCGSCGKPVSQHKQKGPEKKGLKGSKKGPNVVKPQATEQPSSTPQK